MVCSLHIYYLLQFSEILSHAGSFVLHAVTQRDLVIQGTLNSRETIGGVEHQK